MTFTWPEALVALAFVPLAISLYAVALHARRERAGRFGNPELLTPLVHQAGWKRHVPIALALAAFVVLVIGLARPHATVSVARDEATVILTIDTSKSMAARDVLPSRFAAAKNAALAFLDEVPDQYQVGIVSFSSRANVVQPPTLDRELARAAIAQLRPGTGTAIGEAIALSLEIAVPPTTEDAAPPEPGDDPPAAIVLLSDGAQTQGVSPILATGRAKQLAVPVSTVALGTRDATVEVRGPDGLTERVTVPPDKPTLRRIAQGTGGKYYEATDSARLREVYRSLGTRLARQNEERELTSLFAGAGAIVMVIGAALSTYWFRRAL